MSAFELSDVERQIRDTAREFAEKEIAPRAAAIDRDGAVPRELLDGLALLGFMGMMVPEAYGGAGLSSFCFILALEEINRACASTGVTFAVHTSLCSTPIVRCGTEAQKRKWLPRLAAGELLGCYALSEPGAGSDAAGLECRARRDGDAYVLSGTKNFITNGGIADLAVLFARTDPDPAKRAHGISAFIVETKTPGFRVGRAEDKLGIRGSNTVQLHLEDCRVPAENLLGVENEGFKIAMATLDGGRIGIAAQAVGIARACLEASVKYAKERRQFGKPIGDFQAIQWKLAEMAAAIDAARLLAWRAARLRDAGAPHTLEAAMAKLTAARMANDAAIQAVQIHGGAGYTAEFPVERYFRDAKITEIYEGTNEVQRIVIARELLR
jgi:alkylation response protein AidB-like acyl-CoA dehydrogenase